MFSLSVGAGYGNIFRGTTWREARLRGPAGAGGSVGVVSIYDIPVSTLAGEESSLGEFAGTTLLVVNVASKCGLTPQYTALEELHERMAPRGFSVVGFPCN